MASTPNSKLLMALLNDTNLKAIEELNDAAGQISISDLAEEMDVEVHEAAVAKQLKIVHSEMREFLRGILDNDIVEQLDGLVDMAYTVGRLYQLLTALLPETPSLKQAHATTMLVHGLFDQFIAGSGAEPFILRAMSRVIKNNKTKYTSDKARADSWIVPPDQTLTLRGGFYCLLNSAGKMCKPHDYIPVDLSDLAAEITPAMLTLR